jgi:hypothetical protein
MTPKIAHTKVTDSHRWVVKEKHESLPDTEENWKPWLTKHPNFDEAKASLDRAWRSAHLCYGVFEEHVTTVARCSCVHYEPFTGHPTGALAPILAPVPATGNVVVVPEPSSVCDTSAVIEEAVIIEEAVVSTETETPPSPETCPPQPPSEP